MKLAIVQTKPRKGDVEGNLRGIASVFATLAGESPAYDLIALPEAGFTGYFLEGAVYESSFTAPAIAERMAVLWRDGFPSGQSVRDVDIAFGFYENANGTFYNSAMYLHVRPDGHDIVHVHRKIFLPTYGVFDEERFLSRGRHVRAFETRFGPMAIMICEDAWHAIVPTIAAIGGARVLIVPSASPGRGLAGKDGELESVAHWRTLLASYASEHGVYVVYAGLAGFEGGKGMTGSSALFDPRGALLGSLPALGAGILRGEIDFGEVDLARSSLPLLGDLRGVWPDLLEEARRGGRANANA